MKLTNCSQINLIADQENVMGGRWGLIPWAQPNNFSRDTVPLSHVTTNTIITLFYWRRKMAVSVGQDLHILEEDEVDGKVKTISGQPPFCSLYPIEEG